MINKINTNEDFVINYLNELDPNGLYIDSDSKDYSTGTFSLKVDIEGLPPVLENIKAKIYKDGRLEGDYEGYKISGTFDPSQIKWL